MSYYIDAINQATTAATGKNTSSSEDIMGKQDFLTLLVAQLQNQDPLNPDDATEFTAQLAQFSSLEQLTNLNDSMDNMVTSNTNSDRLSTLQTIGKDVAYSSSEFTYTGEPVALGYQLDGTASSVELSVRLAGQVIRTLNGKELTAGNHYLTWDGLSDNGESAPLGNYAFALQATATSGETISVTPLIRSEVTGVDLEGEYGGTLVTKTGEVAFNSIYGVFDHKSSANSESTDEEDETIAGTVAEVTDDITETATAVENVTDTIIN